jgi:hypothetical protein
MNPKHWSTYENIDIEEDKVKLSDNPCIRDLATTDPALMQFFSPVERAIIEICRKVVEDSGGNQREQ